jgi:mannitol-specific phosphotransferase system IIBC component
MIALYRPGRVEEENVQERVQRFGGYLAAMVLPNIAAILAWGLITAFVAWYASCAGVMNGTAKRIVLPTWPR